jgi:hypothetical protein
LINVRGFRRVVRRLAVVSCLGAAAIGFPAHADRLAAEPHDDEGGYQAVEELSYEAIIEASSGYATTLRLRVALHNASLSARDAVHSLALPFASQVIDANVARNAVWSNARAIKVRSQSGRRDPGTVFVRQIDPESTGDIPGAEIIVFGLEPGATIQVEVVVRVYPRLHGGQWELDLPARGRDTFALAGERRVLVTGLSAGESFAVDEQPSGDSPFILTRPEDAVTAAWPARIKNTAPLDGRYELTPGPEGFDDGRFRVYLRLGPTAAPKPDHVIVLVDQSRSTKTRMTRETVNVLAGLFDALPQATTFEAWGFTRHVTPLVGGTDAKPPSVADETARERIATALSSAKPSQGTDLAVALGRAAQRAGKGKRPLVVVMTDGMLPPSLGPAAISQAFEAGIKTHGTRPEVLFVIDDPMLMRSGVAPEHPVARVAASLGARISLRSLGDLGRDSGLELLGSPRVLGDLSMQLPENMTLETPIPSGLVAGTFVLLHGRYVGTPAKRLDVDGRFGKARVARKLVADTQSRAPEALVAITEGELDEAVAEGFVLPPWYGPGERRVASRGITQAGRAGHERKGYLDRKIFRHYLTTRVLPRARVCYNTALTRNPHQSGRVLLQMEIGKGEVMLARTEESELQADDAKLVDCMTEAAWALDIPAGKLDDQMYRIRYPLRLVPPADGVPARVERISDELLQILLAQPVPETTPGD